MEHEHPAVINAPPLQQQLPVLPTPLVGSVLPVLLGAPLAVDLLEETLCVTHRLPWRPLEKAPVRLVALSHPLPRVPKSLVAANANLVHPLDHRPANTITICPRHHRPWPKNRRNSHPPNLSSPNNRWNRKMT